MSCKRGTLSLDPQARSIPRRPNLGTHSPAYIQHGAQDCPVPIRVLSVWQMHLSPGVKTEQIAGLEVGLEEKQPRGQGMCSL